jgi:hypothetical protein
LHAIHALVQEIVAGHRIQLRTNQQLMDHTVRAAAQTAAEMAVLSAALSIRRRARSRLAACVLRTSESHMRRLGQGLMVARQSRSVP